MAVNPIALMSLVAALAVGMLAPYVYLQDRHSKLNQSYLRLSAFLFFWNFFQFMYRSMPTYDTAYVWLKAAVFFGAWGSPFLLHFALRFAGSDKTLGRWWFYAVVYGPSVAICYLFTFTDMLIGGPLKVGAWYNTYATGSSRPALVAAMGWLVGMAIIMVVRVLLVWVRRPTTGAEIIRRNQAKLITIGMGAMLVVTIATELVLRALGAQPIYIGPWFAGLIVVLIGYAMARYQLFVINPATAAEKIVSTMTDSLVITNPQAEILIANEATVNMLGYSQEELKDKDVAMLLKDRGQCPELDGIASGTRPIVNCETEYVTKSGGTIPVLLSCSAIYGARGDLAGSVCVAKDISDRKRAEEATRQAQIRQAYADAIAAVTDNKLVLMTEGEIRATLGEPITDPIAVSSYEELSRIRAIAKDTMAKRFRRVGDPGDIQVAVSEGTTNAVKHGRGATYQIFDKDGTAQHVITDQGSGIDFKSLPKATLLSGYSTKQTLGIGFSIMLELCDRLLLSSQPGGTTLVLEVAPTRR